jgi:hypothetical protein
MKLYRVTDGTAQPPLWCQTLEQTREATRSQYRSPDTRVDQLDVPMRSSDVIDYLNGKQPLVSQTMQYLRTWKLGPRGGLVEVNPGM